MIRSANDNNSVSHLWQSICQHSNPASYEMLFHLLNAQLINFSVQYIHSRHVAEEIVIDVFLKCWLKRDELAGVQNPKTYLYVAVRNRSLNHLKKYSKTYLVDLNDTQDYKLVDVADPQVLLEKKELKKKLDETIESLPTQCKMVFKLIKNDGLKYKEVAELLEISPRTVQNHMAAAIVKLNDRLKNYLSYTSSW